MRQGDQHVDGGDEQPDPVHPLHRRVGLTRKVYDQEDRSDDAAQEDEGLDADVAPECRQTSRTPVSHLHGGRAYCDQPEERPARLRPGDDNLDLLSPAVEIGLVTTDLDAMVGFYEDFLGLEPQGEIEFIGGTQRRYVLGGSVAQARHVHTPPPLPPAPGGGQGAGRGRLLVACRQAHRDAPKDEIGATTACSRLPYDDGNSSRAVEGPGPTKPRQPARPAPRRETSQVPPPGTMIGRGRQLSFV